MIIIIIFAGPSVALLLVFDSVISPLEPSWSSQREGEKEREGKRETFTHKPLRLLRH